MPGQTKRNHSTATGRTGGAVGTSVRTPAAVAERTMTIVHGEIPLITTPLLALGALWAGGAQKRPCAAAEGRTAARRRRRYHRPTRTFPTSAVRPPRRRGRLAAGRRTSVPAPSGCV